MSVADQNLIGQAIGNYEVVRLLGQGGMGAVYLAEHPLLGTRVAVKVLSAGVSGNADLMTRFRNEALAVVQLAHESIIKVSDFGELIDGTPYIVMEYLEGKDLSEVMRKRGAMSARDVLLFLEPICDALQSAHDQGVVHRDLKPDNIFVTSESPPRLKLLDFGIAKLVQHEDSPGLTATGMIMGTPFYVSPEQGQGQIKRIGPWSDIYSLGVILYEMLSGVRPFTEDSVAMLIAAHVKDLPRPLTEAAPGVPAGVAAVVHRCLKKEPEQRVGSADELLAEFRRGLAASDTAPLVSRSSKQRSAATTQQGSGPALSLAETLATIPVAPSAGDNGVAGATAPGPSIENTTMGSSIGQMAVDSEPGAKRRLGPWGLIAGGAAALVAAGLLVFLLSLGPAGDLEGPADEQSSAAALGSEPDGRPVVVPHASAEASSEDRSHTGTPAGAPEAPKARPDVGGMPAIALTPDAGIAPGQVHETTQVRARTEKARKAARGESYRSDRPTRRQKRVDREKRRKAAQRESEAGTPVVRSEGHERGVPGQAAPSPQPKKKPKKPEDEGVFDTLHPEAPEDKAAFDSL